MFTVTGGEGLPARMAALNFLPIIEAEVIRGIRENTAHGIDANGAAFDGYTEQYKRYGRIAKGLSVSPVNLRVKPEHSLLDTLGAEKIDNNHSVISVDREHEKIAEGLSKKRQFMGVSASTIIRVEQRLEEELVRMIS